VIERCTDTLACGPPATPGGPCAKVEACCAKQGDFKAPCLQVLHKLEVLGGDKSCTGAMMDWDFNTHIAVPCTWD
jgi:hypothetical protein